MSKAAGGSRGVVAPAIGSQSVIIAGAEHRRDYYGPGAPLRARHGGSLRFDLARPLPGTKQRVVFRQKRDLVRGSGTTRRTRLANGGR
jgi:hypothetical protein